MRHTVWNKYEKEWYDTGTLSSIAIGVYETYTKLHTENIQIMKNYNTGKYVQGNSCK